MAVPASVARKAWPIPNGSSRATSPRHFNASRPQFTKESTTINAHTGQEAKLSAVCQLRPPAYVLWSAARREKRNAQAAAKTVHRSNKVVLRDIQQSTVETWTAKNSRTEEPAETIILGIDPGTNVMGFGVVEVRGNAIRLLEADAIHFPAEDDHALKLRSIFRHVVQIIGKHKPDELAIEAQFFGKNVQSMLKLGRAQGVAIAAALQFDIPVQEYAPKRVKQSITGNGNATKEQVAAMLLNILQLPELPHSTDATDALAVAVCHHFARGVPARRATQPAARGKGDWGSFVRNNPGRVKQG